MILDKRKSFVGNTTTCSSIPDRAGDLGDDNLQCDRLDRERVITEHHRQRQWQIQLSQTGLSFRYNPLLRMFRGSLTIILLEEDALVEYIQLEMMLSRWHRERPGVVLR